LSVNATQDNAGHCVRRRRCLACCKRMLMVYVLTITTGVIVECVMLSDCPSAADVRSSVRYSLLLQYLTNGLNNFDKTDNEYSLAPTDELIRFWRSKVKGQGHRSLSTRRRHSRRMSERIRALSPLLLSILNLITATHCTITFHSLR